MPGESNLKIAFCLFAYRPFGGLQRDFYRIAQVCAGRGHSIDVFTIHIERAGAGRILASPLEQASLNRELVDMLDSPEHQQWSVNGIRYGLEEDLYSMPEVVADYLERYAGERQ